MPGVLPPEPTPVLNSCVYWNTGRREVMPQSSYMFTPTMPVPHGRVPRKDREAVPGCRTTDTTTQPVECPEGSNRVFRSDAQGRVVGRMASCNPCLNRLPRYS